MGILDRLKQFKTQSHRPPTVRKGGTGLDKHRELDGTGISVAEGRYGSTNIEGRLSQRSIEGGGREPDMSVDIIDLQILDQQTKIQIQTGLRNRIKKVLSFLGDD